MTQIATKEQVLLSQMRHARPETLKKVTEAMNKAAQRRAGARWAMRNLNSQRRLEGSFSRQLRETFASMGRYIARIAIDQGLTFEVEPEERYRTAVSLDPRTNTLVVNEVTDNEANKVEAVLAQARLRDWADENLRPVYEEHWLAVAQRTVNVANSELKVGVGLPERVGPRIIAQGGRRLGLLDVPGDTRTALYRAIAQGRDEQLGPLEIARRIQDEVPKGRFTHAGSRYRSQLIARTETLHASRLSTFEVYSGAENVIALMAHDALLGDTDQDCIDRNGREFTFDEAATEMDETHPNCTLNWSPVTR